jgi:hypothetical protein
MAAPLSYWLVKYFGDPTKDQLGFERRHMTFWDTPEHIEKAIPSIPKRMYVNKEIVNPLAAVLEELVSTGLAREIRTYDGCFNVRKMRTGKAMSRHSFGIALDFNAAWNPLVATVPPQSWAKIRAVRVTWSEAFLDVWRKHGWTCGADWKQPLDGMHFEYLKFLNR